MILFFPPPTSLFLAKALIPVPAAANTSILSAARQLMSSGRLLPGQQATPPRIITTHTVTQTEQRQQNTPMFLYETVQKYWIGFCVLYEMNAHHFLYQYISLFKGSLTRKLWPTSLKHGNTQLHSRAVKYTHWRQRFPTGSPGDNRKHEKSQESRSGDVDVDELKIGEVSLPHVGNTIENTTVHITLTGWTEADTGQACPRHFNPVLTLLLLLQPQWLPPLLLVWLVLLYSCCQHFPSVHYYHNYYYYYYNCCNLY